VRVPVFHGHSISVQIETTDALDAIAARNLLMAAPGLILADEPQLAIYPLPRLATGRDEVMVGRIRNDLSHPRGLAMWISSDNLRKGAATNAVQIAESLVTRGWL
jgi:aspartate-semialdehyde dehydrogenase